MKKKKHRQTAKEYLQKFLNSDQIGIVVKGHSYRALTDARKKLGLDEKEVIIIEKKPYGRQKKSRVYIVNRNREKVNSVYAKQKKERIA